MKVRLIDSELDTWVRVEKGGGGGRKRERGWRERRREKKKKMKGFDKEDQTITER